MDIAQTIKQRAQERGVDPELALAIAKAESGLRPQVKNPKSSAHGLFQIIDDTWKQYGGDPKKRKDVDENIRIGLEILADNQKALATTLGRAPRPAELYAGHFFGRTGAQRVLSANPDAPISSVVSEKVLKANPELLQGKTVSQALAALGAKVGDTGPGQRIPRAPDQKTAKPAYKEDPAKPPVISNAIDATRQYGPGYQAALALSYLSDSEDESDDPDAPSVVEREAQAEIREQQAAAAAVKARGPSAASMLEEMDFGYAPIVTAAQPQQAPVRLNQGGEVSDPEAALFEGRNDVPAKPNMTNKEFLQQALYGVGDLPYAVVGGPVDLASMAMAPFGYNDPKPFMGSADIKERMTRAGIRPADTTDPRLMGPRSAAELLSSMTNPAAATRTAATAVQKGVRGAGEAARMLEDATVGNIQRGRVRRAGEQVPPDTAYEPLRERMEASGNLALAVPAKPSVFTPLPSAEAPFVGRLDKFAAEMAGPMKKEQLLGTLKGKFKDYEIERATRALEDLPADAKVMSTDFLNRLNNVHNPSGYRTTVLEPQQGSFYQTIDNVFVDGDKTPPMGVIHLTQFVDPSAAARFDEVSRADSQLLTLSRGGNMWGVKLDTDAVEKWAYSQPDGFHIKNLLNSRPVQQAKAFNENMDKAQDAADFLLFPGIGKAKIPDIPYPLDAQGAIDFPLYDRLKDEAAQQVRQQGKDMWRALGITPEVPPDPPGLYHRMAFTDEEYKNTVLDAMRNYKDQMRVKAQDAVYPVMDDLARLRERVAAESPYMGQHSSLENAPMPIAFSRYTEREAVIPGMGKAKGIYVHELQSDLLDDVRKKGAKGGSETKDYMELKKVEEKLANRTEMDDSEVYSLLGRRKVLEQRLDRGPYTAEASYRLDEALPNMEQSPQVVQQLMVKNAVSAAIQRGDQFVAFPGKESAQAQLYEKLPRNLDAVVKDLGPGFEKRSIEMMLPNREPAMFNAIVWAPEAAQKLQKSGIPFAKGGMVERNNHDNRSYK